MATTNKSISVVIPNYNGRFLLEKNIPTVIKALQKTGVEYEIIVSDDASTDDSINYLQTNFVSVLTLKAEKNAGFSVTINRGIMHACKDLVFLLNSDVSLHEDYFLSQFHYFDADDTFGVMGSIHTENGDRQQDSAKYPEWKGTQIRATKNFIIQAPSIKVPTFFLSGANALVDRKKLQFLGGMDEIYSPFYFEDVDLGIRAWRMNWKCYYEDKAVCYHPLSETIGKYHKRKKVAIIAKRNKFVLHAIHLEGSRMLIWRLDLAFQFLFKWLSLDFKWYKSFFALLNYSDKIKQSKTRFAEQMKQSKAPKSLEKVMADILGSVKDFEKKYF